MGEISYDCFVKMEFKCDKKKMHCNRGEVHMDVPLVKLPLGKVEDASGNAKEGVTWESNIALSYQFYDCATTFASFYTGKAVRSGNTYKK